MRTRFQNHNVIELRSGASRVRIAPQFGARLLDWISAGREIVHWPADADWGEAAKVRGGNPILFPFIARHMIDGEVGKWKHPDGRILDLPMHGFARDLPFTVLDADCDNEIRMRLEENAATLEAYPYAFRFDVWYRLDGEVLTCGFEVTNKSQDPMPWYAGHHFYFAVPAQERPSWTVTIPADRWARQNPDGSIAYEAAGEARFPLAAASVDRVHILQPGGANPLLQGPGWGIEFDLAVPGSLPWHAVTTWSLTPDSDFYCVEPWLGLPNAIHHGDGLRHLPPGQTERAVCRLRLTGVPA